MPALLMEKKQRLIISVLFRLLIIGYSIFLLIISENIFSWYFQIVIYATYAIIFSLTYGKDKLFSFLRLINDYLFIFLILYQYDKLDLYSFSMLFLPILNSQNHTGEKRSILLYIFPILAICIVSQEINTRFIIPFIFFFFINLFEGYRTKSIRFHEKLNSVIDNFFTQDSNTYRPYKIYKECIPILNNKPFNLNVEDIFCFKYEKGRSSLAVVNGSKFIWNYKVDIDIKTIPQSITNKRPMKAIKNVPLTLNKTELNENIVFISNIANSDNYFLFFLITDVSSSLLYNIFGMQNMLLMPLFSRLIKVFEADLKQKTMESHTMLELGTKMNYVNSAVKTMHFIRNKLGPVKNYISMEDDYDSSDEEKKKRIEPYLKVERQKVELSLGMVLERANFILEKSNNPFVVSSLNKYGIQQLFSEFRRIWGEYRLEENFDFLIERGSNNDLKKYVYYNKVGMDLVLTNWISNIHKYNSGEYGLIIEETESAYKFKFFNSIKINQPEDLDFIKQFASDDRLEIDKRKSHGLSELKEFLTQMNIQATMSFEDNNVLFIIELVKRNEYEESINI